MGVAPIRAGGNDMKKVLPFLFVLVLLSQIFADGGISAYNPQTGAWQVSHEARQLAAINFQDGKETMLVAVEPSDLTGSKLVWVFPVPASASKTKIGLANEFPEFSGSNVETKARESVQGAALGLLASQVYLAPLGIGLFGFFPVMSADAKGTQGNTLGAAGIVPWYEDYVQVRTSLERNGLVTELVETKVNGALYYYLKGKGLELPYDMQQALDVYVGKDYSYVVSYMDDVGNFKRLNGNTDNRAGYYNYRAAPTISVSVEFPTDRIYFPLMPTGVYKENSVPAWIYVMGHVTPEIYQDIKPDTKVEYFTADRYPYSPSPNQFYGKYNYESEFKFTKIYINTPSANFVQDLWMTEKTPAHVVFAGAIADNSLLVALALFALFSCLSSYLAGKFIFKSAVPGNKLALVGLSNFLTIFGFAVATYFLIKPSKKMGGHCRMKFVALFSALCLVAGALLFLLGGAEPATVLTGAFAALIGLAALVGFIMLPQVAGAYAYFHFEKIGREKLLYPSIFAALDIVPIIAVTGALTTLAQSPLLPFIVAIAIALIAEGYLLAKIDAKTFAPRRGLWTVAVMKGAVILLGLCIIGILWLGNYFGGGL